MQMFAYVVKGKAYATLLRTVTISKTVVTPPRDYICIHSHDYSRVIKLWVL